MAAWDFGRVSRLVRQRGSLRQGDMAELTGLSQAFLSMLESGARRLTNIDKIIEFLQGLDVPPDIAPLHLPGRVAATVPQSAVDPLSGDLDPALPWTPGRMVTALDIAVGGDALDRRKFLTVSGVALTAYAHHWGTTDAEPWYEATQTSAKVSARTLSALHGIIDDLRMTDAGAGSGTLAKLGRDHLRLIRGFLRNGTYTEETGRELAAIAADTAAQTGWFYFDAGDHERAQIYLLAALRAAHASGDVRLGAGALSYLAIYGYSTGNPRDAVSAARSAREKTKSLHTPALEAMLLTRQARGHAKLGEQQGALAVLGRAAELCAQGRSEQDPPWLYWVNEGEIYGQSGSCFLDLGDAQRAVTSLAKAHAALNPTDHRTRGLFLTRAASAYLRQGDVEAGCDSAHEALDLAEQLQSHRLNEHVETMLNDLHAVGDSTYAQELLDRAATLAGAGP
ncbi:helix-turn-helix transcriptional regulator [Streptomyces xanthochromogenes]